MATIGGNTIEMERIGTIVFEIIYKIATSPTESIIISMSFIAYIMMISIDDDIDDDFDDDFDDDINDDIDDDNEYNTDLFQTN